MKIPNPFEWLSDQFIGFVENGKESFFEFVKQSTISGLEWIQGVIVLFALFCTFTLIFGNRKMTKYVPICLGVYILLLGVQEWLLVG